MAKSLSFETTRFGVVEMPPDRIITFANGLYGYEQYKRFCLLEPAKNNMFYWLQSAECANLAFVLTTPELFDPGYKLSLPLQELQKLGSQSPQDMQIFIIVSKIGHYLTGNFRGPLVINVKNRQGAQYINSACLPTAARERLIDSRDGGYCR